jgi:DNA-binding beta-propeller fold protein YncE
VKTIVIILVLLVEFASGQYLETTIDIGFSGWDLLWNPTSNKLYCVDDIEGQLVIVDGHTNQLIKTLSIGGELHSLGWNSRENKVYCSSGVGYSVYVIDGVGDTVLKTLNVSPSPSSMVYVDAVNKVYVRGDMYGVVTVVDAHRDTAIGLIAKLVAVCYGVWHPVSNLLFLPTVDSVALIDCVGDSVVRTVPCGAGTGASCRSLVNDNVYVGSLDGIDVLSASGDPVAFIPGGYVWPAMSWAPCPNKLYVPYGRQSTSLRVIDCNTNVELTTLDWNQRVGAMLCDTIAGKVYVGGTDDGYVYIFDAWADTLIKRIYVGQLPQSMEWNVTDRRVYVLSNGGTSVAVIREETGMEDSRQPAACCSQPLPTVLRSPPAGALVFDAMGRRVLDPKPGIYFVREVQGARGEVLGKPRKVIVTR